MLLLFYQRNFITEQIAQPFIYNFVSALRKKYSQLWERVRHFAKNDGIVCIRQWKKIDPSLLIFNRREIPLRFMSNRFCYLGKVYFSPISFSSYFFALWFLHYLQIWGVGRRQRGIQSVWPKICWKYLGGTGTQC